MKKFILLVFINFIFAIKILAIDNDENKNLTSVVQIRAKRQGCGMMGGCWGSAYSSTGCSGNSCGNQMISPCTSRHCQSYFSAPTYQCRPGCTTPACCRSVVPNPCANCAQPQGTNMIQMPPMNIQIKQPPRCCPCCMPACSKMCIVNDGCNSCYDYYNDLGYGKK